MPTHLGGEPIQTPPLARGSSVGRALTERPACFEIEPRWRAVKRAINLGCGVGRSSSLRTTCGFDLLFTMSDNLHRGDRKI
jgi:hypothetical protein